MSAFNRVKTWVSISIAVALSVTLLGLLFMTSGALQNSTRFEHLYTLLLLGNGLTLLALLMLIVVNLRHLIRQVQKERAGARLTVRLVSLLMVLSMIPVIIVYYFSLQFLHQKLDGWFDINVEQALTDALDLSRSALDIQMRQAFERTEEVAAEIAEIHDDLITVHLNELRDRSGALELILLTANGQIIAANTVNIEQLLPTRSRNNMILLWKQRENYVGLQPIADRGLHILVMMKILHGNQVWLLHALFPLAERLSELASRVETVFNNYKERAYLHEPLKLSFTLVLSLVLLLSILSAAWAAFFTARRFVAPLTQLAEGTKAVASGDYEKQLPIFHFDELGFLVHSFNQMTRRIAQSQEAVKHSQQIADNQRAYLEAVLQRLSSGVISLDPDQFLRTANPSAAQILGLPLSELIEQNLEQLQNKYPALQTLCSTVQSHLNRKNQLDWREEITLFGVTGRKVLLCRGTQLQFVSGEENKGQGGYVIVFDDITALIQAQRDAAWSEVARRLAHEIKNPLTPIQLSAERLRHKYLRTLPPAERETLERMTHTIIQQVEAMKEMVNTFSDYAKNMHIQWQSVNLNQLIREVLELYHHVPIHLDMQLDDEIPCIQADRGRLRQILHNLIKNAIEANSADTHITVSTRYLAEFTFECVELRVQDQGPGVSPELIDRIFEPYVTTKPKGTGLGLAIVRKIVEEHGGTVWIENHQGACIAMRLPITSAHTSDILPPISHKIALEVMSDEL